MKWRVWTIDTLRVSSGSEMLWSVLTSGEEGNTLIQRKTLVYLNWISSYCLSVPFFFFFAIKFVGTVPNQIPAMMSHQEGAPVFGSLSLPVFANCWEAASWLSVAPGCHHGVSRAGLLWKGEKWGVGRAESTLGRGCPMCILTDGSAVVIYHPWLWVITGWDCIYCFFWFKK